MLLAIVTQTTIEELQAITMQDSKDDIRLKRDQDFEVFMQNLAAEKSTQKRESSISKQLSHTNDHFWPTF